MWWNRGNIRVFMWWNMGNKFSQIYFVVSKHVIFNVHNTWTIHNLQVLGYKNEISLCVYCTCSKSKYSQQFKYAPWDPGDKFYVWQGPGKTSYCLTNLRKYFSNIGFSSSLYIPSWWEDQDLKILTSAKKSQGDKSLQN